MAEEVQQGDGPEEPDDPNDVMSPERSQPTRGTVTFLAPELLRTATPLSGGLQPKPFRASPAVDVWALGVTLYLLLEGKLPWSVGGAGARGYAEVVDQILTAPIVFR